MQVDEKRIAIIVEEVLRQLGQADGKPTERVGDGIFRKVDGLARAALPPSDNW